MSGIILEHADHVAEVNERVTDGGNIYFARVKGSPGDHTPSMAKSVHSNLHHPVSVAAGAAQEDAAVYRTAGGESLKFSFKPIYVN